VSFLAVVVVFPLLLALLCLGSGLLVGRLAGTRLPAPLLPAVGFGALVVVSQFTTRASATAPLTPWALLALALVGFAVGRRELAERWRARGRGYWWLPLGAVFAYVLAGAPVIAAGRLTFPDYLIDTTGAIQLAGAEWLLHHGAHFPASVPGFGTTLNNYFGNGYPSGGHTVLAGVGWLSGQDLLWLYSPFQAVELALTALVLAFLAARSGLGRAAASVTGAIAAVPALVYSYALMGSIKELTALPMLMLMGGLVVLAHDRRREFGVRSLLPFAVAAAAALGAIGLAAAPWVACFGLALLVVVAMGAGEREEATGPTAAKRREPLRALAACGILGAGIALLALPTVGPLSRSLTLAKAVSGSNPAAVADPGNLLRPLKFVQTFGVWLGETHRLDPRYFNQTYLLVGVVVACALLGLVWLVRGRAWSLLACVAIWFVVWDFLTHRGTNWTDAKLLMLLSPVVLLVALVGAFGLARSRRAEGALLAALVIGGVLASDALLYHGANMAPTKRFVELSSIGARFAGEGPALAPDFEEYDFYLLRKLAVDLPGVAYSGPFGYARGAGHLYGESYDLDALEPASVERFRTIVMRRSPAWSRPPSNFQLQWSGAYYTVWRRQGPAPAVHVPLGSAATFQPSTVPSCPALGRLAAGARRHGEELAAAVRPANLVANLATAGHSATVGPSADLEGRPQLTFGGPGRVQIGVVIRAPGSYELWLGGDVDRPLHVLVDGRAVGAPAAQSGDDGTMIHVVNLTLSPGHHLVELVRYGGSLRPGDHSGTVIDGVVLEPLRADSERIQTVAPDAWRSLCGQRLDWVEVLSGR
jgi:hypothetical protein